jgi:hypothetical protein
LLLFLLTRFTSQVFLVSCVMVVQFGHEDFLVGEHLTRTQFHNWTAGGMKCGTLARPNTGNHQRRAVVTLSGGAHGGLPAA